MNDGNSPDAGVVRPGAHLTVHYRLSLPERGEDVISTFGGKPATFELGQGQLSESLERVIIGMREGERAVFELGPEQAYGDRQAALVRTLSRSSFDANVDPGREHVPGDVVDFPMPGGGRYAGVVKSIDAEAVELDFNHPLAGRRIAFEVEILGGALMEVLLAQPRGFCAGVDRAIEIVERALELFGAPIYVRHEIVHNEHVVGGLRAKGAVFVDELDQVPEGATVVFSAHGVSQAVRAEADTRGLVVFDATCPLVTKVHVEVAKMRRAGREVVMIGHAGHPEVEGTMGQADSGIHLVETVGDVARLRIERPDRLAFVSQTTLSVDDCRGIIDALKARFPAIREPKQQDICYATQNRQDAVKMMAPGVDLVLVIGSPTSSNSNRLREVAEKLGCAAHMIRNADELDPAWLEGVRKVGITAGASAPEVLVQALVARLRELGVIAVRQLPGATETMTFPLPKGMGKGARSVAR